MTDHCTHHTRGKPKLLVRERLLGSLHSFSETCAMRELLANSVIGPFSNKFESQSRSEGMIEGKHERNVAHHVNRESFVSYEEKISTMDRARWICCQGNDI